MGSIPPLSPIRPSRRSIRPLTEAERIAAERRYQILRMRSNTAAIREHLRREESDFSLGSFVAGFLFGSFF